MRYLIVLSIFLFSCNPCKRVSKHPECFSPDTITKIEKSISYEKIFITEDSIIVDTLPCDPVDSIVVYDVVYKTIWRVKIDTFYKDKEVVKINPLDALLKKKIIEHEIKVVNQKKIIFTLSLILLLLVVFYFFRKGFFS